MSLPSTLRLRSLKLTNYRGFESCKIDLDPSLTVLVAENGCGKTAILDAIAIALGPFVDHLDTSKSEHRLSADDMRITSENHQTDLGPGDCEVSCVAEFGSSQLTWKTARSRAAGSRVKFDRNVSKLRNLADQYKNTSLGLGSSLSLPLIAFYRIGRLVNEHEVLPAARVNSDPSLRLDGYFSSLDARLGSGRLSKWIAEMETAVGRGSALTPAQEIIRLTKLLDSVRAALNNALDITGYKTSGWSKNFQDILLTREGIPGVPLRLMSTGIRLMVELVGDIALRAAVLNQTTLEDPVSETGGVVLIDEIDMHLHPRWQQHVLTALTKAFPAMQMVVTTHSPQVISTVSAHSLRMLTMEDGTARINTPGQQTRGVRSGDLLARIMGVDPLPDLAETQLLSAYRALIEDGRGESPEAVALRTKLNAHYGTSHPVVLDTDRLLRFQAIRLRKRADGEVDR